MQDPHVDVSQSLLDRRRIDAMRSDATAFRGGSTRSGETGSCSGPGAGSEAEAADNLASFIRVALWRIGCGVPGWRDDTLFVGYIQIRRPDCSILSFHSLDSLFIFLPRHAYTQRARVLLCPRGSRHGAARVHYLLKSNCIEEEKKKKWFLLSGKRIEWLGEGERESHAASLSCSRSFSLLLSSLVEVHTTRRDVRWIPTIVRAGSSPRCRYRPRHDRRERPGDTDTVSPSFQFLLQPKRDLSIRCTNLPNKNSATN